jgi:hypothetical protein
VRVSRNKFGSYNARYRFTVTPDPVGVSEGASRGKDCFAKLFVLLILQNTKINNIYMLCVNNNFYDKDAKQATELRKTAPFCLCRYFAKQKLIISS